VKQKINTIEKSVPKVAHHSAPGVDSNAIYFGMNIRGWREWKKEPPRNAE
jgi:hypothetical protein